MYKDKRGVKLKKLTLEINYFVSNNELKNYLSLVQGVNEVNIKEDDNLIIDISYDSNLINPYMLKSEILLFLNMFNKTSILVSFDKHLTNTKKYQIIIKNLCCEYCLLNMIEELFEIEGIGSSISNFTDDKKDIKIYIEYDENIIDNENLKELELKFNS